MRVLHLLKTSVGATWALRQVRELTRLGVDVHVALPAGGPLVASYEEAGATTHRCDLDFPLRNPRKIPEVSGTILALDERLRPDIIHSHFVSTTLTMRLGLGRSHPTRRVFQVPGPLHLEHAFFRRAELMTAGARDHWIGSCAWTCDRYRRSGVPSSRVHLSYYGTDVDAIVDRPRGKLRAELGVGATTKLIGMVAYMYGPKRYLGQTRGLKGHEDLIDAVALLPRSMDVRCVMVGAAWNGATAYEAEVRSYAERRAPGRIVFLGLRRDVPDLYPDFDVAVHPSHSENVGGAVESLLAGVPTIASNVGGFPDVVRPGETGWLVAPKQPRDLAQAISVALASPEEARRRADAGRALVAHLFDVRRTAQEVRGIYDKIMSEPAR